MNVSFFQTYGDRLPLLKARTEDLLFKKFLDKFDLRIIGLHDVSDNVKNYINQTDFFKDYLLLDFKGINYCQCIKQLLDILRERNVERFLFYQDDTFSYELKEYNVNDLIEMIFNFNYDVLNISYKTEYLIEKGKWTPKDKKILHSTPSFNLYDTSTFDFRDSGLWSFDDSCFVCNQNALWNIYDERYLQHADVWHAELYLKFKYDQICMNRFITDTSFFINYNILGHNTNKDNIDRLKKGINLSENTLKLLQDYERLHS